MIIATNNLVKELTVRTGPSPTLPVDQKDVVGFENRADSAPHIIIQSG